MTSLENQTGGKPDSTMDNKGKNKKAVYVQADLQAAHKARTQLTDQLEEAVKKYNEFLANLNPNQRGERGDTTDLQQRSMEAEMDRLEAELGKLDPSTQARIARKQAAKRAAEARRARIAANEAASRDAGAAQRHELSHQTLCVIKEEVSIVLDGANNTYQCYINKAADRETTLDVLKGLRERITRSSTDRALICDELIKSDAESALAGAFAAISNYQNLVLNEVLPIANVDCWEELLPDTPEDPITIPNHDIQRKLLEGVTLEFPFSDDKPSFRETASHPMTNSARVVGTTMLWMKAAKMCRIAAEHHFTPKKPPVVFDIGAGSFGAKRLHMLRCVPANVKVAMHVTIPILQDADNVRDSRTRHNGSFLAWNYLPETKEPSLTTLNYCRHKASECDCLKYYDERARHVTAIHSAYYFTVEDWDQIFKYTSQVECLLHVPKVGETIPLKQPEFEWVDCEHDVDSDWLTKTGCFFKRMLTGDRTVKLKPLRHGETTYLHSDMSQIIRRGGFHFTKHSWMEKYCQGDSRTAKAAVYVAAAGAVGSLIGTVGAPAAVVAVQAAAAAVNAVVSTAVGARVVNGLARRQRPFMATRTVTCHVTTAFGAGDEEDIVTTQRFTCGAPKALTPEPIESINVDTRSVGRVAAAITMAKDAGTGMRQMAASLLREDVPIQRVRDTIRHATRIATYVIPNGLSAPSGARWLYLASALPLFASAPLAALSLTPAVAYLPPSVIPAVVVSCLLMKLALIPTILLWCLIASMA